MGLGMGFGMCVSLGWESLSICMAEGQGQI